MRISAGHALALGLAAAATGSAVTVAHALPAASLPLAKEATASLQRVGFFCSPGYEASYGGRCVATPARSEVDLYQDLPTYYGEATTLHRTYRRHRRQGLHERF